MKRIIVQQEHCCPSLFGLSLVLFARGFQLPALIPANHYLSFNPVLPSSTKPVDVPTEAMRFQTTHWTVVMTARAENGTASQEALASLCSSYWYPLYAFVRRQGASPHEAEDVTQEFFYD